MLNNEVGLYKRMRLFLRSRSRVAGAFIVIMVSVSAGAQSSAPPAAAKEKKQKRTTINFEDQLIEGRASKPELFVLLQNRMNNSRRLFKLRENFLPEMRKTAEDVGRADVGQKSGGASSAESGR